MWLWVKNTGYPKKPLGKRKRKNKPKPVVPKGGLFLTYSHVCFLQSENFTKLPILQHQGTQQALDTLQSAPLLKKARQAPSDSKEKLRSKVHFSSSFMLKNRKNDRTVFFWKPLHFRLASSFKLSGCSIHALEAIVEKSLHARKPPWQSDHFQSKYEDWIGDSKHQTSPSSTTTTRRQGFKGSTSPNPPPAWRRPTKRLSWPLTDKHLTIRSRFRKSPTAKKTWNPTEIQKKTGKKKRPQRNKQKNTIRGKVKAERTQQRKLCSEDPAFGQLSILTNPKRTIGVWLKKSVFVQNRGFVVICTWQWLSLRHPFWFLKCFSKKNKLLKEVKANLKNYF